MPTSRKPTIARAAGAVACACAFALAVAGPASAQTTDASPSATAPAKGVRVLEAKVTPRRAYYYGLKPIRFSVTVAAGAPTDLRIDIVRKKSGALERSLFLDKVAPQTASSVTWDGLSGSGTAVRGKLRFVVKGANGAKLPYSKRFLRAASTGKKGRKKGKTRDSFGYFDYIFPVRAKHGYGDGIGAPRGDHTHQGQDISAPCGTKLVAAQGGNVKVNAFQAGGAGYYVVITTIGGIDHVYMHLIGAPALTVGQTVLTGQAIGQVGNTGSSSGCHLHYEMWSAPGWFAGGSLVDPTPSLRAWDKYS